MYKKLSIYQLAIFSIFCTLFVYQSSTVQAETEKSTYTIKSISTKLQKDGLVMVLQGNSAPAYTMYELFNPARVVLDIAEASIAPGVNTDSALPANDFAKLNVKTLSDQNPAITRFEITLAETHGYKIDRLGNNLSIQLFQKSGKQAVSETAKATPATLLDIVVRQKTNHTEVLLLADTPIKN